MGGGGGGGGGTINLSVKLKWKEQLTSCTRTYIYRHTCIREGACSRAHTHTHTHAREIQDLFPFNPFRTWRILHYAVNVQTLDCNNPDAVYKIFRSHYAVAFYRQLITLHLTRLLQHSQHFVLQPSTHSLLHSIWHDCFNIHSTLYCSLLHTAYYTPSDTITLNM